METKVLIITEPQRVNGDIILNRGEEVKYISSLGLVSVIVEKEGSEYGVPQSEVMGKFVMPEWMEEFRLLIGNTGGNSVEDLMNDVHTTSFSNPPRWAYILAVRSQVQLLIQLKKNILKNDAA